jgi:hypothetical protein
LLADYFAAIRNEVAIDEMFLALSQMNAAEVGHLPRVPHWIGLATRRPYLTRALSRISRMIWLAGGSALFFMREYLKFSHSLRSAGTSPLPNADGVILGLSTRVFDIVKPAQFPAFPKTRLTLPWAPLHKLSEGAQELPILSILDKRDCLSALANALTVTLRMQRHPHLSPWVLQTYTAFRWFLVRRAVDRLSGTLVTTEHFDRWAVLVDRAVRERRRVQGCRDRLIVVQHGAMGPLSQDVRAPLLNLPTRLRQVDELHTYNSTEAAAFCAGVFARGDFSHGLDLHFFKPAIELAGETTSDRLRLLFVGHPLCEYFHVEVFRKVKAWGNFEVYYKPHPNASMSASMVAVEWTVIENTNIFPRVDLLVSYPSTLVIEYEGIGIPASVHPLNASIDDLSLFAKKTQEIIENKIRERHRKQRIGVSMDIQ